MYRPRLQPAVSFTAIVLCVAAAPVVAVPVIEEPFHFLDNRAANSVGLNPGLRQLFGALSVTGNAGAGIAGVTATQGAAVVPLVFQPFEVAKNFYANTGAANVVPDGAWALRAVDIAGAASVASTPDIFGATAMAFLETVRVSGSSNSPTFEWTLPSGTTPDAIRVNVYDRSAPLVAGVADVVFAKNFDATASTFTINPGDPGLFGKDLSIGRNYTLEIGLLDLRDPSDLTTLNGNILSRSRAFFDFSLDPAALAVGAFLPRVCATASTAYCFTTGAFVAGERIFIDPEVAVGYDYAIGQNDPLIRSVLLPDNIGDGLYEVLIWNVALGEYVPFQGSQTGGTELDFGADGVTGFRVLGIEPSAGLDPADGTAFVTGLTFVAGGTFSGTMTPITAQITAQIPEPGVLALLGLGVLGLAGSRQRISSRVGRNSEAHSAT